MTTRLSIIVVLNASNAEQSVKIAVHGGKLADMGTLWRMAPDKIDATVQVGRKREVMVDEQSLGALPGTITVRPFSVNIYSWALQ